LSWLQIAQKIRVQPSRSRIGAFRTGERKNVSAVAPRERVV
jgi:hypothetical protein